MRDPWNLINYGSNTNKFRTHDYLISVILTWNPDNPVETLETMLSSGFSLLRCFRPVSALDEIEEDFELLSV